VSSVTFGSARLTAERVGVSRDGKVNRPAEGTVATPYAELRLAGAGDLALSSPAG
jgi:hypothetical protein